MNRLTILLALSMVICLCGCNSKEQEINRLNKEISKVHDSQTANFKNLSSLEETYRLVRDAASPEKIAELKNQIATRERRSDSLTHQIDSLQRLIDSLKAE